MEYTNLGRAGIKVSKVCLGTLDFGTRLDEARAIDLVKHAIAAGVNFIDTANLYGKVNFFDAIDLSGVGRAEEITGKALKGDRHSVILATKLFVKVGPDINDGGLSRRHIMMAIEDSLRRLQTDFVDVYYTHAPDYSTPMEETLRAMDDLVHQGKVRYTAVSNYHAWQLCKALWLSDRYNLVRPECIQIPYNLIARSPETELLPLCASEGVGVTVWAPLAGGMLSGNYDKYDPARPLPKGVKSYPDMWTPANHAAITRLKKIAEESGRSLARFALAWLLNNKTITSVVCGVDSVEQLNENLKAVDIELSEDELSACDEVWRQLSPPPNMFYGR
jgi:aryl-alcohol dehydrogenase-like predicted oxidoreductase